MKKRSTKWYRKNESELMKRLGLKPTRNSGAGWIEKADGENEHFLCELKSTDKESFSIKQKVLQTLEYQAGIAHKIPLFAFQFLNLDEVWLAIKESDIEAYKELIRASVIEELEQEKKKQLEEFEKLNRYCLSCNFYVECEKNVDKKEEESYNIGEGEGGKVKEAVSFMPNSNPKNIDVKQVKNNINARNKYLKQKEQEREQKEKEYKNKKGITRKWKRS